MTPLIAGSLVNLGGVVYTIPPLSFKQLRSVLPKINLIGSMSGAPTEEEMDAVIDVVHAALTRNYPEFTRESVEEVLDLGNAGDVIKAIMGTSGLEMVKVSGKEEGNS